MSVVALILAGGEGSRLGHVRKAELRLGGKTLLQHVFTRLPHDIPHLISTGQGATHGLPDLDLPLGGPMAGIVAAVDHLTGMPDDTTLATVAVDTPFLPPDYVKRLVGALKTAPSAVARFGEDLYPTNAAYRLGTLRDLPTAARAGTAPHSPKRLQQSLGAIEIDWSLRGHDNPFANLNTLKDLILLTRRIGS